jgi:hypothetical protein
MIRFEILFFFDNPKKSIVEVKRNKPAEDADLSETFYWLMFDKADHTVKRLQFVSMCCFPEFEKREFVQGNLKFNQKDAHYISSETLIRVDLDVMQPDEVPEMMLQEIGLYFKKADEQLI